jgi:hypothetical protein
VEAEDGRCCCQLAEVAADLGGVTASFACLGCSSVCQAQDVDRWRQVSDQMKDMHPVSQPHIPQTAADGMLPVQPRRRQPVAAAVPSSLHSRSHN